MKMQQQSIDQMLTPERELQDNAVEIGAESSGYESTEGIPVPGELRKLEIAIQRLGQKVNNNFK